jgi:hypothetical protein
MHLEIILLTLFRNNQRPIPKHSAFAKATAEKAKTNNSAFAKATADNVKTNNSAFAKATADNVKTND